MSRSKQPAYLKRLMTKKKFLNKWIPRIFVHVNVRWGTDRNKIRKQMARDLRELIQDA